MEITGVVKKIEAVQEFGNNGFKKQNVIVETQEEKYPQTYCIELHQDNVNLSDSLAEGEVVTFKTNIRGKEWTNPQGVVKYFTSIVGWSVSVNGNLDKSEPQGAEQTNLNNNESDDLPF